jgi:hypothetical protein
MDVSNQSKLPDFEDLTLILDEAAKSVLQKEELRDRLWVTVLLFFASLGATGAAIISTCAWPSYALYLLFFLAISYCVLTYLFARMFWLLTTRKLHRILLLAIIIPGSILVTPLFLYGLGIIPSFHAQKLAQEDMSTLIMYIENQRRVIGHPPSRITGGLRLINPGPFCRKVQYYRGPRHYAIKIPLYDEYFYHLTIMYSSKSRSWKRAFGKRSILGMTPEFPVINDQLCEFNVHWSCIN